MNGRHDFQASLLRWWAVIAKEFLQLKRDRLTFAMIVGIPIMQLLLFGYAINSDPRHLPTALVVGEYTSLTRSVISGLKNSSYFDIVAIMDEKEASRALNLGSVLFVLTIPPNFTREALRGEAPNLLLEADATDPTATSGALAALQGIVQAAAKKEFKGPLARLRLNEGEPFSIITHRLYNPEGLSHYNIVPGLVGVILTLTTVMMTALAITRERERGTMENLLAMPLTSMEIMTGKIVPYIFVGVIQMGIIILLALVLFRVPFNGNPYALCIGAFVFIAANLIVGISISSFAGNQLQALQMSIFYFMPNLLLSGFMFPFLGMPAWAQYLGNLLPLTHFNRLVRGILLKGNAWSELWPHLWPMLLFCAALIAFSAKFSRRTLD